MRKRNVGAMAGQNEEEPAGPLVTSEDQYKGRDSQGLLSDPVTTTEVKAFFKYCRMYAGFCVIGAGLGALVLYIYSTLDASKTVAFDAKMKLLHDNELGWMYLIWYVMFLAKMGVTFLSNAARSQTRIGNPDQHCYMLFDKNIGEQHYVFMKTTGPQGRFNRAQRSHMNMMETMTLFVAGALLTGYVVGPVVLCIASVWGFGRFYMTVGYRNSAGARLHGFLIAMVMEMFIGGLVLTIGVSALANWHRYA